MIYRNSVLCLNCNKEIISRHRHDYVTCECGNISEDGGLSYLKRQSKYLDTSLTDNNLFEEIREGFEWGSYGKTGDGPLRYIKLKDMEISHIEAVIKIQPLSSGIREVFLKELAFRAKKQEKTMLKNIVSELNQKYELIEEVEKLMYKIGDKFLRKVNVNSEIVLTNGVRLKIFPTFLTISGFTQKKDRVIFNDILYTLSIDELTHNYHKINILNTEKTTVKDNVNSPSHYTHGGIETWDYAKAKLTKEELVGAAKFNVLKYLSRGRVKNGVEDFEKAQWYLTKLIELESETSEK